MKYNIHSDNLLITDSIKDYINEKLSKLNKYFENADSITARVVVKVRGREQIIEVTIPTVYFTLRNEEKHDDLYAAIDIVVDKLERQIRKNKTRMQKKGINKKTEEFCFDYDVEESVEDEKIIRRKIFEMKPMNEEEAILQMNMLGHDFFIYRDDKTDSTCVIYKRKDGHYGVIETK